MANTYIVNGSQFKPYTFDEMLKPALMYKQAYDAVEEGLNNLEILSSGIEDKLTDSEADKIYKDKYADFNNQISGVADLLLSGDLNKAKKEANKLKTVYAKELNPINEAYARKLEYQKTLQQLKAKDGIIVAPTTLSTSDFLNGNTPDLPNYYSLKDIEDSAKDSSIASAKRLYSVSGWTLEHGDSLISRIEKTGFNEAEFNQAYADFLNLDNIMNDVNVSQQRKNNATIFANIFASEMQKRNTTGFSTEDINRESQAVLSGMRKGLIGSTNIKTIQNPYFDPTNRNGSTDKDVSVKTYPVLVDENNRSLDGTNKIIADLLNGAVTIENGIVTGLSGKNVVGLQTKGYWDEYSVWQKIGEFFDLGDTELNGGEWVEYKVLKDGVIEAQKRGYITLYKNGKPFEVKDANDWRSTENRVTINTDKINEDIKKGVLNLENKYHDAINLKNLLIPIHNPEDKQRVMTSLQIRETPNLYKTDYDPASNTYKPNYLSPILVNEENFKDFNGFKIASIDGSIMLSIGNNNYALPMDMYKNHASSIKKILDLETNIANNTHSIENIPIKIRDAYDDGTLSGPQKQELDKLYTNLNIDMLARGTAIQKLLNDVLLENSSFRLKDY